jgi:LDH2 family malate/lactate/ureidoglycolate dehydrogenase
LTLKTAPLTIRWWLTSLGGSPENSSYKGYGLAVMVNILASCLSGATLITDPEHTKMPVAMDIAHFFMAIDPAIFRAAGGFESDVATFLGALRGTVPVDPTQPVMVAGGPQRKLTTMRWQDGLPVGAGINGAGPTNSAGRCGPLAARLAGRLGTHWVPGPWE